MEKLKLSFESEVDSEKRIFYVKVPYKEGIVITNEFCPVELLSDKVELLAAVRGEPLDRFMEECRRQVLALSQIEEAQSQLDQHIGGLMAVVMDRLSGNRCISYGDLLFNVDCFALLLQGAGFDEKEIREIYPRVLQSITELYPDRIKKL